MADGPAPESAPKKDAKPAAPPSPPSQAKIKAAAPPPTDKPKSAPKASEAHPSGPAASPPSQAKVKAAPGPVSQAKMKAATPAESKPAPHPPSAASIPTAEIVDTPSRTRLHERSTARVDSSGTKVRHRADAPPKKGIGLQVKIMLAMGLTSLLGAGGIAAAVYSRTSTAF